MYLTDDIGQCESNSTDALGTRGGSHDTQISVDLTVK